MEDADALYVVKQQPGELRKPTQKEVSGRLGGETEAGLLPKPTQKEALGRLGGETEAGLLPKPTQKEVSGIIGGETNSGGKTKHDIWGLRWRMS